MPETLERDRRVAMDRRAIEAQALLEISAGIRYDQPLEDVLRELAANIVEHTRASSAAATLLDPTDLSSIAYGEANVPAGYTDAMIALRQEPREAAQLRKAVVEGRTWVLRDAREAMLARPAYAPMSDMIRQVSWATVVGTAFAYRPEAVAVVYLCYDADVQVDEEEVSFARAISHRTAPLMDNAWLFSESQRRAAELDALARADAAMHESLRLDDVFGALADLAIDLLGADQSALVSWDTEERLSVRESRGLSADEVERLNQAYRAYQKARFADFIPAIAFVEDVGTEDRLAPQTRNNSPSASIVELPVVVGERLFGFFTIGYARRRNFNHADRVMFDTLSRRAALAIQNALLFEESTAQTRELDAKVAQLEALHRADAALHESLRLRDVFEAMVDLAVELLGADRSILITWDEHERLHAHAARGVEESELAALNEVYHTQGREQFAGRVPHVTIMEDVQNDPRLLPGVRRVTPSASTVDIPVVIDGEFFGVFVVSYLQRRVFTPADRELFETLATRTSLAIQNARLYERSAAQRFELEARVRQMEALRTIAAQLTLDGEGTSVYDELAEQVVRATEALVCAVIVLEGDENSAVRMLGTAGLPPGFAEAMDEGYALGADSMARQGILGARLSLLRNARIESFVDERLEKARALVVDAEWDTLVSLPIIYHEKPLGMLVAGYPAHMEVDADEAGFLAAIADQGAIALANARLMEAASNLATAEERQRLARELHDSVSQALYGIALGAKTARKRLGTGGDPALEQAIDYVSSLAEAGLTETRALIFELIPESLQNEGLIIAIKRHAAAVQARYQFPVHVDLCEEPDLPIKTKEAIYRITQESLNNIAKHAGAQNAFVALTSTAEQIMLTVRDDGAGFNPTEEFPGHFGLQSMRERARRIAGRYEIASAPGKGATVTLTVPLAHGQHR